MTRDTRRQPRRAERRAGVLLLGVMAVLVGPPYGFAQEVSAPEAGGAMEGGEETAPVNLDSRPLKDLGTAPNLLNAAGLSRGVDAIIAAIRKREVDLAVREQRVAERERAVTELEDLIEKRSTDIDRIRQQVENRIAEWSEQGRDRVTQLAEVYSTMKADRAAILLSKMELDLAVSVVRSMKKKSAAAVLAVMRPDRALLVSRRLLKPLDPQTDAPAARAR